jgi:dihydrofolate reductase
VTKRKIIVHIATSADGYIARPDGNVDWLTNRPAPKGFYGLPQFMRTVDAKILGRKTFDLSVKMSANFSANDVHYVLASAAPFIGPRWRPFRKAADSCVRETDAR